MIEINGEKWEIAMVSPFSPGLVNEDGSFALGCCDDKLKIIFINKHLNKKYLKKVLCHELTHAAMFSYNI
jgi:Zn-dependent peptidase ImmA (M78 family)